MEIGKSERTFTIRLDFPCCHRDCVDGSDEDPRYCGEDEASLCSINLSLKV